MAADIAAVLNSAFPIKGDDLQVQVTLCGLPETISVPTSDVPSLYVPLLLRLSRALSSSGRQRALVGVSGPAGSGKTTLAAVLTSLCNSSQGHLPRAATVSMDAYHQTNAWHAARGLGPFKGRHDTYHATAFANDLALLAAPHVTPPQPPPDAPPLEDRSCWGEARICSAEEGVEVLLPAYDRAVTHDPVLGQECVLPSVRLVFVEGLFVARTAGVWERVRSQLIECIALDVPLALCRSRALHRRLRSILIKKGRGGALGSLEGLDASILEQLTAAEAHYRRADMPTFQEIEADMVNATVVLEYQLCEAAAGDLGRTTEEHLALPVLKAIEALERHGSDAGRLRARLLTDC